MFKRITMTGFIIIILILIFFYPAQGQEEKQDQIQVKINISGAIEVLSWPVDEVVWAEHLSAGVNESVAQKLLARSNGLWYVSVMGIPGESYEQPLSGSLQLIDPHSGRSLQNPLMVRGQDLNWQMVSFDSPTVVYNELFPTSQEGRELEFYFSQELDANDQPGTYRGMIVYSVHLGY